MSAIDEYSKIVFRNDKIVVRLADNLLSVHEVKDGEEILPIGYMTGYNAIALENGGLEK